MPFRDGCETVTNNMSNDGQRLREHKNAGFQAVVYTFYLALGIFTRKQT